MCVWERERGQPLDPCPAPCAPHPPHTLRRRAPRAQCPRLPGKVTAFSRLRTPPKPSRRWHAPLSGSTVGSCFAVPQSGPVWPSLAAGGELPAPRTYLVEAVELVAGLGAGVLAAPGRALLVYLPVEVWRPTWERQVEIDRFGGFCRVKPGVTLSSAMRPPGGNVRGPTSRGVYGAVRRQGRAGERVESKPQTAQNRDYVCGGVWHT